MEVNSSINQIKLDSIIKVNDIVMVVIGNDNNENDWQYGEKFKVKKIEVMVYGIFAYNYKNENISINRIIPLKKP